MTRFKTNPLQSAANHKSAQGLVIIAKRWSQISGIIFFVTISYIILTIDVQITVNVYQKRHSLLHLSQIHAPLGTIHKRRWQLFRIFDTPLPRCWQFFSTIHLQFWPIFGYQEGSRSDLLESLDQPTFFEVKFSSCTTLYAVIENGISYVVLSLFCFCCNGLKWMHEDEQEEKDWQIKRVRGRVVSSLRSGTFGNMYGVVRNHLTS